LANDGEIKYYKDNKFLQGGFWLTKDSECLKTAQGSFEIRVPNRTYCLEEVERGTSNLDEWTKHIQNVIKSLR